MSKNKELDPITAKEKQNSNENAKEKDSQNLEPVFPQGAKKPKMTMR